MTAKRGLGSVAGQESHAQVTTMKATVQHRYGPPDVLALEEIGKPVVGDQDVLLRVHAVGLNAGDGFIMLGVPYFLCLFGGLRRPRHGVRGWMWPVRLPRWGRGSPTWARRRGLRILRRPVARRGLGPLSACRRALTRTGILVPNANTPNRWLGGLGRTIKALVMAPFVPQRIRPFVASVNQADLLALTELIGSGKVTPVIDRTYPLSQVPDAIGYLEKRHARGKVVVTI